MTLSKIRQELEAWFKNNIHALLECEISDKQVIKYIYSAKSKENYQTQWKYIQTQLDPIVQAYVRYYASYDPEGWVALKRINPSAPEHVILKEKRKDVRTIWKLK